MKHLQQRYFAALAVLSLALAATPAIARTPHTTRAKTTTPAQTQKDSSTAPAPAESAAAVPSDSAQPQAAKPGALNVPTPPPPSLTAKSWVLMDFATGQTLADASANERVVPASITKVMTSYVVSAELAAGKIKMEDEVFISENAWRGGGAAPRARPVSSRSTPRCR